jgi:cytochrome c oxidase cbb3-type subunit 3
MNTMLKINRRNNLSGKAALCLVTGSFIHLSALAGETIAPSKTVSLFFNPLFIALLIIAILLLIAIIIFADVVKAAAYNRRETEKKKSSSSQNLKSIWVFAFMSFGSSRLIGQTPAESTVQQAGDSYYGLDSTTFYVMLSLIAIEVFVAASLYGISMQLLGVSERKDQKAAEKAKAHIKQPSLIEKLNASVAIEQEEDIMLDHNYDGIRELDNNLPPWWKYGFYLTIVFAVVYLIHFHVSNTGKLQLAEYEDQLAEAKIQHEEFKKKSANLVDENNATVLLDEGSLASGKTIFMDNCAACHGRAGEGGVGPNLTDDYWLHQGGIKDIFKTIKYGWPEKGMKSWQQDLGAKQIHEISSYIKSLHGTNPANAKEKQGELYKETIGNDSIQVVPADSMQLVKEK